MSIATEITALQNMSTPELAAEFERVLGKAPRYRQPKWMAKRIAHALHVAAFGGLPAVARAAIERLNAEVALPTTAPARTSLIPPTTTPRPGTILQRDWRDQRIRVAVLNDGFEWDGQRFGSLSAVAKAVTGQHWSGPRFFNLTAAKTKA